MLDPRTFCVRIPPPSTSKVGRRSTVGRLPCTLARAGRLWAYGSVVMMWLLWRVLGSLWLRGSLCVPEARKHLISWCRRRWCSSANGNLERCSTPVHDVDGVLD